jgi:hypothetical protein
MAEGFFRDWVDWEAAEGTPLEAPLARLPQGMAAAIRWELAAMLADEGDVSNAPRGSGRGRR